MTELERVAYGHLSERLALLTPKQREFFKKLYPNGPGWDQIKNAENQIERTIKKNENRID